MYIFEIDGAPIAQKQTQFGNGHAYNPSAKDEAQLRWQLWPYAPSTPLTGPIEASFAFFMPIPKATSAVKRRQMENRLILPIVKPDIDNLAYLVTNTLKKMVYEDDKQICALHLYKYYSLRPRTVMRVRCIEQITPVGLFDEDQLGSGI